jgi:PAS domain S-box-containing protein
MKAVERLRILLESAPDGMIIVNPEGRIVACNAEGERLFGYSGEELPGQHVDILVPVRMRVSRADGANLANILSQPGFWAGEDRDLTGEDRDLTGEDRDLMGLRRDGREFPIDVSLRSLNTEDGVLIVSAIRDITERKQFGRSHANKELREREEHIRLLLDSTAQGIYEIDLHGHCTFANSASARLLGYADSREFLGRRMHDLIHHTRADGTPYPAEECRISLPVPQSQGAHVEDEVFWRSDGSSFPAEYWSYPVHSGERLLGQVVTFVDITERRELEERVRRVQQRLRDVLTSSPAILFTLTVKEDMIAGMSWVSGNLREILGYSPGAALGSAFWELNIHPDDLESVRTQAIADLLERGRSTQKLRFRHAEGAYRWIGSEMRLLRDAGGHAVEVIGAWLDITESKRIEEEKTRMREQLQQAQKLESIGRLAGGVAHDFNHLLTVINGYSDLLLRGLRHDDPIYESLSEIGKAGKHAANLTSQLLLLSRGRMAQTTEVSLNEVIADIRKILARVIGEDIRLEFIPSSTPGYVLADASQLRQVVLNLAVNARDAMPGGGTLLIETDNVELDESYVERHAEVKPGPCVQLKVSDTGMGMTEHVKAHLFEPFSPRKERAKGRAWVWRRFMALSNRMADPSGSTANRASGRCSLSIFPGSRPAPPRGRKLRRRLRTCGGRRRSLSWRTRSNSEK